MDKEFEINGCVSLPENVTEDEFWTKFIEFIEANKWSFGGSIKEIIDGYYTNEDGTRGKYVLEGFEEK